MKKSDCTHSGMWAPTPALCLWRRCCVTSLSRASPACPALEQGCTPMHSLPFIPPLCSKQPEAAAGEGKEAGVHLQAGVHLCLTMWHYLLPKTHLTAPSLFGVILLLWQLTGLSLQMRFLMKCEGGEDTHITAVVVVLSSSLVGVC